ncbi:MAG: hypothetical protein E6G40_13120, partial [Actinobacteria bacterium]
MDECPLWTRLLVGATTKAISADTVTVAMSRIVFLALQNPYAHAIGKFRGKPISAESRRIFAELTLVIPSFCRFEG